MSTSDFTMSKADVIAHALRIVSDLRAEGITPTLRQVYYQFVAQGFTTTGGQKVYKRIGAILTEARYSGAFPVAWLTDSGRDLRYDDHTRNDDDVFNADTRAVAWMRDFPKLLIQRGRWYGQPVYCSVWFEKEALSGVFGPVCNELGVSWLACKGYPSVSVLNDFLERTRRVCAQDAWTTSRQTSNGWFRPEQTHDGTAERVHVLYLGDHDPDGFEIPQSAERNIAQLQRLTKGPRVRITFERIALNMDQIEKYDPPPFDAKITSARYQSYVDAHDTTDAWELDALEPTVLRDLIRDHIAEHFDEDVYDENEVMIAEVRDELRARMLEPEWAARALDGTP